MTDSSSLSFSNTIDSSPVHADPTIPIPNFTATGRAFTPSTSQHGSAFNFIADSMGQAPPDLLPRRYNDASLIGIPVLPPSTDDSTCAEQNPVKHDTQSPRRLSLKFWKHRHASSISTSPSQSRSQTRTQNRKSLTFVMRQVTRAEYLKHYAKDDDGRYIGTEEPAPDCILRDEGDLGRWRGGGTMDWRNEI